MTKCNCPIDKIAECFSLPNCRLTRQPEAQRLADSIEDIQGLNTIDGTLVDHAARELRRLHEVNAELLAAFKDLPEANSYYFPTGNPWGDRARAAIAKATGETEYD